MKKSILTDALGSCPSLKGLVAAILRTDTYIRWELVSASCEGELCLTAENSPSGLRSHISIRCPDDVDALNKLSV